jgi:hypothetical protein
MSKRESQVPRGVVALALATACTLPAACAVDATGEGVGDEAWDEGTGVVLEPLIEGIDETVGEGEEETDGAGDEIQRAEGKSGTTTQAHPGGETFEPQPDPWNPNHDSGSKKDGK